VVLRAIEKIVPALGGCHYVGLVPEPASGAVTFLRQLTPTSFGPQIPDWDLRQSGVLCWELVAQMAEAGHLSITKGVLDFNKGQIY
jgi:hypothetical protein